MYALHVNYLTRATFAQSLCVSDLGECLNAVMRCLRRRNLKVCVCLRWQRRYTVEGMYGITELAWT